MNSPSDGLSSDAAASARGRYGIGERFLSYLSATWCGSVPIVLGVFWTAGFIKLIQIFYPHLISTHRLVESVGALAAMCVGGIVDFALGVAFGRFLLRAMPPQLLGGTTRHQLAVVAVSLCAPLIGICIFFILLPLMEAIPLVAAILLGVRAGAFSIWDKPLILPALAGGALFLILWTIGAVGPLILRHNTPRAFLDSPFVLFLRRFSTFSDRTVVALILRQAKAGVPVVFLTPTLSRPKDWDPFLVGFAFLKLLHPLRSVPIVLRARDEDWQQAADELISRAQTILLDTSAGSASLRAEAEMIEKTGRWLDTVNLRYTVRRGQDPLGAFGNARCIDYSKSWTGTLPRLVISLLIVLLPASLMAVPLVLASALLLDLGGVEVPNNIFEWTVGLVFIVVALTSYSIFWGPAVSRKAATELRKLLRAKPLASPAVEQSASR